MERITLRFSLFFSSVIINPAGVGCNPGQIADAGATAARTAIIIELLSCGRHPEETAVPAVCAEGENTMKLTQAQNRIFYIPNEKASDRPYLYYLKGDCCSAAIDAGNSAAHDSTPQ